MTHLESYDWLAIREPEDYLKLVDLLDEEFGPNVIAEKLKEHIAPAVKFILIERHYVDKDYRSTFYNFYAKKGRPYRDDCVRLHFFDGRVEFDEIRTDLKCSDEELGDHYFGYIVLRPTNFATLGRSVLSPDIRVGARGQVIQSCHQVHLLGHTLFVWGFPSMAQHTDITVCAHVSCWAILRHYSERFPPHREFLMHDITELATPFNPGGLTPSLGLDIYEAERIFQAADCFPVIVVKQRKQESIFNAQLLAYLESGFPLFVAINSHQHAIVIAGCEWRTAATDSSLRSCHVWSQVNSFVAIDDNRLPYSCVNLSTEEESDTYTAKNFDAFIVALPEKIYYPAHAVESISKQALYSLHVRNLNLPSDEVCLRRYFITTISALRRFAHENRSQMGEILVGLIMRLNSAQFIWVVEYATSSQWANGHIAGRSIIDATASPKDNNPVWLSHNEKIAIVFDRSTASIGAEFLDLKRSLNVPMSRIESNLRPVRA